MAFSFKAASIAVVAFALSVTAVLAQDTLLEDTYGQGVHEFNKGNYAQAITLFSAAIDGGYQEPTVYYFRGFATAASGDTYGAKSDFAEGARLEAKLGTDPRAIGLALQRLQGATRVALETERRVAKIAIRAEARAKEKARYGDFLDNQNRVLRNPQGAGDVTETIETPTEKPVDPPTESVGPDPFGGSTTEPMPGKGSDPFGGSDPLPEPGGTDPFGGDTTPAEDPKGADPFGGDTTPAEDPKGADPFGGGADPAPTVDPKPADPFGGGVDPAPEVKPVVDDPFGGGADPAPTVEPKPADPFGGGLDPAPEVKPVVDDPFGGPDTAPPSEPMEKGKSAGVLGSIFKAIGGSLPDEGASDEPKDSPFIDEPKGDIPDGAIPDGAPGDPFGEPVAPGGGLKPAVAPPGESEPLAPGDPFGDPVGDPLGAPGAPGESEPGAAPADPFGAPGAPGESEPDVAPADPFGDVEAPGESEPAAPADPFDS